MKKIFTLIFTLAFIATAHAQVENGTLLIGDYNGATKMVEGSYFDVAPTSFYLAHTGSQILYTADDLAPLAEHNNVKLNKITFRFSNFGAYETITRRVRVYAQATEATEFAKIEGVKQFFDFDDANPIFDVNYDYELADTYGDDGELELDLSDLPFEYKPGSGMLLTVVMDAIDNDNCLGSGFDLQFYTSGVRNRAMTYTANYISFIDYKTVYTDFPDASATLGCGTGIDLPVTKIEYTYTDNQPLTGDINGDGKIDVDDVNTLINVMLGVDTEHNADINGDNTVDVQDLNTLLNIILGL